MTYEIVTANGETVFKFKLQQVKDIHVMENVYYIYDTGGVLIFSAPVDSVVHIALA